MPSETPTEEPSYAPTADPTTQPSAIPTVDPTANPTCNPTAQPSANPSAGPTAQPRPNPTAKPTSQPSAQPTADPTAQPTANPSANPSSGPTSNPTADPSSNPTINPTAQPTVDPTAQPSAYPTDDPTVQPTAPPTANPTADPTAQPTANPTAHPSSNPTAQPTANPIVNPSSGPTSNPTCNPTAQPSANPSAGPTTQPSPIPTAKPTAQPSAQPTADPTAQPTANPSSGPTSNPTVDPTSQPSPNPADPTSQSTADPTAQPTANPQAQSTVDPTAKPSANPSANPTAQPTAQPSANPTADPIAQPSANPTAKPTYYPTADSTSQPTVAPSFSPSKYDFDIVDINGRCPFYAALNTNSTTETYFSCSVYACPGTVLTIGSCNGEEGTCIGDQYLRLFDTNGKEVSQNDDSCGLCSQISFTVTDQCQTFSVHEGCYNDESCSGVVMVTEDIVTPSPSFEVTNAPTKAESGFVDENGLCPFYSAIYTYNAEVSYSSCSFYACPGTYYTIGSCESTRCNENQFLRLFDSKGVESENDNDSCGKCSQMIFTASECQMYSIHEGCLGDSSCSGIVSVTERFSTANPTAQPSANPIADPSADPTSNPSTNPIAYPTEDPTADPTANPTTEPSADPSFTPSETSSADPSYANSLGFNSSYYNGDNKTNYYGVGENNHSKKILTQDLQSIENFYLNGYNSTNRNQDNSLYYYGGNETNVNKTLEDDLFTQFDDMIFLSDSYSYSVDYNSSLYYGDNETNYYGGLETNIPTDEPILGPTLQPALFDHSSLCPYYNASHTNYALQNYETCTIYACPRTELVIGSCDSTTCHGDQYLTLIEESGRLAAHNDDSCGICSQISFTTTGPCQTYRVQEGCYNDESCGGIVEVRVGVAHNPTSQPSFIPTIFPTLESNNFTICPAYEASDTNYAQQNYESCGIYACPGTELVIGSCDENMEATCTGDQFLALFDKSNRLVAHNDDSCGLCSQISFSTTEPCQTY
jgi:hypothetical protein